MENIYKELHSRIQEYSVGMIPAKNGIEMRILKRLFTEDEARVYLKMTRSLESAKVIGERCGFDEEKTSQLLESMTGKGITFPYTKDTIRYYAAAPFMHGFFEQQLVNKNKDHELSQMIEDYLSDGFRPQTITLRTVPVGMTVELRNNVYPYDDIRKIIEGKDKIAVSPCFCRSHILDAGKGDECKKPHEMCLGFDYYAHCIVEEFKIGKYITRDEALHILKEAENAGLVHQTAGNLNSAEAICNCCPDCCAGLRFLKLHPAPGKVYPTNYYCVQNSELCTDCGICVDRCPMYAIIEEEENIKIKTERCIGCGLCVTTCPTGAMELFTRSEIKSPPEVSTFIRSSADLMNELDENIKSSKK